MVEWKILQVHFQILHPNKAHIPISQHINTLHVLNEVSINLSYNQIVANSENKI